MTLDLATILQAGGPTAITLLLAYLYREERLAHKATRESLDDLTSKILRKAGVIDGV